MRIFKYPLQVVPRQMIHVPKPHGRTVRLGHRQPQFLSVAEQDGQLVLWVAVDPHCDPQPHIIRIQTTGDEISMSQMRFIGTAMLGKDGPWFVAHVFLYEGLTRTVEADIVDLRHRDDFSQINKELELTA